MALKQEKAELHGQLSAISAHMHAQTMTMPIATWVAIHLNIQWGCGMCFGYISGYLSKIREHVQSHHRKSSRDQSNSSHRKNKGGKSDSSSNSILSNDEGSVEEFEEEEEDDDEESSSYADEVSPDASDPE